MSCSTTLSPFLELRMVILHISKKVGAFLEAHFIEEKTEMWMLGSRSHS